MTREEAVYRIENHIAVHRIGLYPHIKLGEALDMAIEALQEPERKHGRWEEIRNSYGELEGFIHIGCGYTSLGRHKFCPSCGAYMWGESE